MPVYSVSAVGSDLNDGSVSSPVQSLEVAGMIPLLPNDQLILTGTKTNPLRGTLAITDDSTAGNEILFGVVDSNANLLASYDVSNEASYIVSNNFQQQRNRWMQNWTSPTDASDWSEALAGTSTVNRDDVNNLVGDYCARMDIDAIDSQVYMRLQGIRISTEVSNIKLMYKTTSSGVPSFDIKNNVTLNYMQEDGSWGPTVHRFIAPTNEVWSEFTTPNSTFETITTDMRITVFADGANQSVYLQGIIFEIFPEWKQYDGDTFYINHTGQDSTIGFWKCSKTSWDETGVDALEFVEFSGSLAEITPGKVFYDFATFKLYYTVAPGENITDTHFEAGNHSYTIQNVAEHNTVNNLLTYGSQVAGIQNNGAIASYNKSHMIKGRVYGGEDRGGAVVSWNNCTASENDKILYVPEEDKLHGNGFVTLDSGTVSTYTRCLSYLNGDDGFQNDLGGEVVMLYCSSFHNYSEQIELSGGPATVLNSVFYDGSFGYTSANCFQDKNTNPAVIREYKNNIVYGSRLPKAVFIADAGKAGITESNNCYFPGTADAPWGVTNGVSTDPQLTFVNNQGSLGANSPCIGAGFIIPGIHDQPTLATDINNKTVLFAPNMGAYDGRTTETITEVDYTPERWSIREGATVFIKGGGHVDASALSIENENITFKVTGSINQFTPAGTNTSLTFPARRPNRYEKIEEV